MDHRPARASRRASAVKHAAFGGLSARSLWSLVGFLVADGPFSGDALSRNALFFRKQDDNFSYGRPIWRRAGCSGTWGGASLDAFARSAPLADADCPCLRGAGTACGRFWWWARTTAFEIVVCQFHRRGTGGWGARAGWGRELPDRCGKARGGSQRGRFPAQQGRRLAEWHRGEQP